MDHVLSGEFQDESGLLLGGPVTKESLKRSLSLDLNSDDVIVASYPKSGININSFITYNTKHTDVESRFLE